MKKSNDKVRLGSFEIESGKVRISDPCYDKDTWCAGTIDNVKKGSWFALTKEIDGRVGFLIAYSVEYGFTWDKYWDTRTLTKIEVGVDSGQAGIFDEKYYKDDKVFAGRTNKSRRYNDVICPEDIWYSWCCDVTLAEPSAGVIPFGCVSSSGWGDGCYTCSVIQEKGKVVAIVIDYGIEEEDEQDENDDYEDEEEVEEMEE